MKYLLLFLLWGYNAGAQTVGEIRFASDIIFVHGTKPELIKCKHIYVATYRDTVESSCHIQGDYAIGGWGVTVPGIIYNVGVHSQNHDAKNIAEGINLVCVKCLHQTKQKILYTHKE